MEFCKVANRTLGAIAERVSTNSLGEEAREAREACRLHAAAESPRRTCAVRAAYVT